MQSYTRTLLLQGLIFIPMATMPLTSAIADTAMCRDVLSQPEEISELYQQNPQFIARFKTQIAELQALQDRIKNSHGGRRQDIDIQPALAALEDYLDFDFEHLNTLQLKVLLNTLPRAKNSINVLLMQKNFNRMSAESQIKWFQNILPDGNSGSNDALDSITLNILGLYHETLTLEESIFGFDSLASEDAQMDLLGSKVLPLRDLNQTQISDILSHAKSTYVRTEIQSQLAGLAYVPQDIENDVAALLEELHPRNTRNLLHSSQYTALNKYVTKFIELHDRDLTDKQILDLALAYDNTGDSIIISRILNRAQIQSVQDAITFVEQFAATAGHASSPYHVIVTAYANSITGWQVLDILNRPGIKGEAYRARDVLNVLPYAFFEKISSPEAQELLRITRFIQMTINTSANPELDERANWLQIRAIRENLPPQLRPVPQNQITKNPSTKSRAWTTNIKEFFGL